MKIKPIISAFLFLNLCACSAWAQLNYEKSDFENIAAAYVQYEELELKIAYRMYADHESDEMIDEEFSIIRQKGKLQTFKMWPIETVLTPSLAISIDHEEKIMVIDKIRSEMRKSLFGLDMEGTLELCDSIFPMKYEYNLKSYQMYINLPEFERVDIYFKTDTWLLEKMVLFYREGVMPNEEDKNSKPRLEMIYEELNTQPNFSENTFSEKRFVSKTEDGLKLLPAFEDYLLYDYSTQY